MIWFILVSIVLFFLVFHFVNDYHPKVGKLFGLKNSISFKIKYLNRFEKDYYYLTLMNIIEVPHYNKAIHDEEEYLYSVAHEIGHVIFERIEEEKEAHSKNFKGYKDITRERKAWKIAEIILEEKGLLKQKKKFYKLRDQCLADYKRVGLKTKNPNSRRCKNKFKTKRRYLHDYRYRRSN